MPHLSALAALTCLLAPSPVPAAPRTCQMGSWLRALDLLYLLLEHSSSVKLHGSLLHLLQVSKCHFRELFSDHPFRMASPPFPGPLCFLHNAKGFLTRDIVNWFACLLSVSLFPMSPPRCQALEFVCLFFAAPCGMWDLSSSTRDRTCAPCSESVES